MAECLTHDIVTQADSWDELRANVREAVGAYFFDQPLPSAVLAAPLTAPVRSVNCAKSGVRKPIL